MATDNDNLNDYQKMIRALLEKRAQIDAAIANIVAASGGVAPSLESGSAASFTSNGSADRQPTELPRGAFLGKSLPAAVKLYLSAVMKKQTIKEITAALREGGVETTSPSFENVITGALNRMKSNGEILRFKDGWGLPEFYPEHLRRSLSQAGAAKPKATGKKGKKDRKQVKAAKPTSHAPLSLDARIEAYTREHIGEVVSSKQIAFAMTGESPQAISLSLWRLAKKFGWNKTTDGGYHIMGKVQNGN